jgi:molybdate transport system ATP-binding protein
MDEPLASLDQARKQDILPFVERLRDELHIPIIYVSHSVAEVARLANTIVVMANGRVLASGSAKDIMQRFDLIPPDELDEAGVIIDMNVHAFDGEFGMSQLRSPAGDIFIQGEVGRPGTPARVRIRARDVMVATSKTNNISALNILRGRIVALSPAENSSVNVTIDCAGTAIIARLTRRSVVGLGLTMDQEVFGVVKSVSIAGPGRQGRVPAS